MARILVAYTSKYGSAKQYAEWIASELGADLARAQDVKPASLAGYDAIIYGGYLHIGRIAGAEFVKKNWALLSGKNVCIFSTHAAPKASPEIPQAFEASFPPEVRAKVKFFPLSGRVGRLDLIDRILMLAPKSAAEKKYKETGSDEAKREYERMKNGFDEVDRKEIAPLVKAMKNSLAI